MAAKVAHLDRWLPSAARALDAGAVKRSALTLHWNAAGREGTRTRCLRPVPIEHRGGKAVNIHTSYFQNSSDNPAYRLEIEARCRKCENCLRARAAYWRLAAVSEIRASVRTWFGTLTLSPDVRFLVLSRARLRLAGQSIDYDAMSADEQFSELVRECNPSLTRYLKRVRKESGAALRYLLVSEAHKDGMPHWHILVHESQADKPVKERCLRGQWKGGFAKFNLVAQGEETPAAYVAKYLAKEARTRVRASLDYGTPPLVLGDNPRGKACF